MEIDGVFLEQGTQPIPTKRINELFRIVPQRYRVYFLLLWVTGMRPSEPLWDLNKESFHENKIIFRPSKTKKNIKRVISIPNRPLKEIKEYIQKNNYNGHLFPFKTEGIRRVFNQKIRPKLPKPWNEKTPEKEGGAIRKWFKYTLRSFRATHASAVFYFLSKEFKTNPVYVNHLTAKYMGHSTFDMTASYYISRMNEIKKDLKGCETFTEYIEKGIYGTYEMDLRPYTQQTKKQKPLIVY